jgi:hypothetical protein
MGYDAGDSVGGWTMEKIDIVTTCMGRLSHLQRSLPLMLAQENVRCILVDYSCPEQCGDWVEEHLPEVQVVRVPGQEEFNVSKARNAGARAGRSPWIFFLDADRLMRPGFLGFARATLFPDNFLTVSPYYRDVPFAVGNCIVSRHDYETIGGYDEQFLGWGGEDVDFIVRLEFQGLQHIRISSPLMGDVEHGDKLRTRHAATKDISLSNFANLLYASAKLSLQRLVPVSPDKHQRMHLLHLGLLGLEAQRFTHELQTPQQQRRLYRKCRRLAEQTIATGSQDVYVPLPGSASGDFEIERNLHFHLDTVPGRRYPGDRSAVRDTADNPLPPLGSVLQAVEERWPAVRTESRAAPLFLLSAGDRVGLKLLRRLWERKYCLWEEPFRELVPLDRLADTLRQAAESVAENPENGMGRDVDRGRKPELPALLTATRHYLETALSSPSEKGAARNWGCAEVQLDAEMARLLKWLYPRSRLLFLLRDPYQTYRSLRKSAEASVAGNPGQSLDSPESFGRYWLRLARGFMEAAEELDAVVVRYEELISPGFDWGTLEPDFGDQSDEGGMPAAVVDPHGELPDPPDILVELFRLSNVVGSYALSIGYPLPTPAELSGKSVGA